MAKFGVSFGVERGMVRLGMSRSFSSSFGLIILALAGRVEFKVRRSERLGWVENDGEHIE